VRYAVRVTRHCARYAALIAPVRLPQAPQRRGYWYDPTLHALVGQHIGLDLHRRDGRYHVIETNVGVTLRPERRALYDAPLDPIVSALVSAARSQGFERVVFLRGSGWSAPYHDEFQLASLQSGLEVLGLAERAPPERLEARTVYVVSCSQRSLLSEFLHDKYWSAKWLQAAIDADPDRMERLAYVPTSVHVDLSKEVSGCQWPNLVIKIANLDRGEAVALGRFRSRAEARRALQKLRSTPGAFALKRRHRLFHRTIFQPFVPAELWAGRPRVVRLHSFVSPLFGAFLSCDARVGRLGLPSLVASGQLEVNSPFIVSFHGGNARYARVESTVEEELRLVSDEFASVIRRAVGGKFRTAPTARERAWAGGPGV
jgi:hypothetical protein